MNVVVIAVVVNVIVMALLVVTDHILKLWSTIVHLGLLKADVEFLWWWWSVVCKAIFVSNPTAVLRL